MPATSTGAQYSKLKKEKNFANVRVEVFKAKCNYPTMKKEILAVIRGIEKFLIFLVAKPFLIQTDCKAKLGFVKKNLSNMQVQRRLLHWDLWLN